MGRHEQGGEMEWKGSEGKCGIAAMLLTCFSFSCRVVASVCVNNANAWLLEGRQSRADGVRMLFDQHHGMSCAEPLAQLPQTQGEGRH